MPYFPETEGDLPANRFLIFADQSNLVRVLDESKAQKKGQSFTGYWTSPTLNRKDPSRECTLRRIIVFYDAQSSTTITVRASGDGGDNWNESKTVSLASGDGLRKATGFNTTGIDLRVQFRFDQDIVVGISGFTYKYVLRSDLVLP